MKQIVVVANILLLTVLAGLAVDLFYDGIDYHVQAFTAPRQEAAPTLAAPDTARVPRHAALAFYQPVVTRNLFQIAGKAQAPPVLDPAKDLEVTELNIKLWGTVTGKTALKYAVIEATGANQRREQHLYREGDRVETALIEKILDDKIIISNQGQRQVLRMEKFLLGGRRGPVRRAAVSGRPVYRRTISRGVIDNATQNFDQLIGQAQIEPINGGMQIAALQSGSILRRLGLRKGDVVTSVNDRAIRSMDDAMNIYRDLQNGNTISIQLLRRSRPLTYQYNVK